MPSQHVSTRRSRATNCFMSPAVRRRHVSRGYWVRTRPPCTAWGGGGYLRHTSAMCYFCHVHPECPHLYPLPKWPLTRANALATKIVQTPLVPKNVAQLMHKAQYNGHPLSYLFNFMLYIRPALSSGKALGFATRSLNQCCRVRCSRAIYRAPRRENLDLCLQIGPMHGSAAGTATPKQPKIANVHGC